MSTSKQSQGKINYTMCSNKTCCPVLTETDDNNFTITDDYNGKVILTKEELILLKNFLKDKLEE
jgi:hypothetical protein